MFQVSKNEIITLRDDELRELIGLLCESNLSNFGISPASVTYGGNQDAPDDGVDVIIDSIFEIPKGEYIPRKKTIIQVKVSKMTPSSIEKEMKPNGTLRNVIKDIIAENGAYIIVSSKSDVTNSEYNKRLAKMQECISGVSNMYESCVDFYDCNRITSWVNMYPAIKIWVKNKTGFSVSGWQSYSDWKKTTSDFEREFIFDETSFVYKNDYSDDNKTPLIDAIIEMRGILSTEAKSIRIAGLSGVGKSRLAYSLFETEIGQNPLDRNQLIYCDVGNEPTPSPITFIQYLISLNLRAIIIVDNCMKEQHSKLANIVNQHESKLSLLTIEYDAKIDDIIEVENYYMVSSSDSIIKRYLENSYPEIHPANIDSIVNTSGGNFRMAKYFAVSIDKSNSIGILNSSELFKRLFMQDNMVNETLLKTAEVCSLVYSFNIKNELKLLSELSNLTYEEIYRNVALLQEKQLIQSRGDMRALLPHGLANKLCSDLLKATPTESIINILNKNFRVLLSFSRRTKYLHSSPEAIKCAMYILTSIDEFSDLKSINGEYMKILTNLVSLVPIHILSRIESIEDSHFFSRKNANYEEFVNVLIKLSYEQEIFDRVISLLFKFAIFENENTDSGSIRNQIKKLYHVYLSGTHASVKQRLDSLEILFDMGTNDSISLAFYLLNEMLLTEGFVGHFLDSSSMKRDYGYHPKTYQEIYDWYEHVLDYIYIKFKSSLYIEEIKILIANNFRGLLRRGLIDYLERFINDILEECSWPKMWISIMNTKYFDKDEIPDEILKRLVVLAANTRPKNLEEEFIVYIKECKNLHVLIEDTTDDFNSLSDIAINIGIRFGKDFKYFKSRIDLIKGDKNYRAVDFGIGLSSSSTDFFEILNFLINELSTEEIKSNASFMKGLFIGISSNYPKISIALEEILKNDKTKMLYPSLQSTYKLKKEDLARLERAINNSSIPIKQFECIVSYLNELEVIDIIKLLEIIPKSNEGIEVIISCIFYYSRENHFDERLIDIAARNILMYDFSARFYSSHQIYEFEKVSRVVFKNHALPDEVRQFFIKFKQKLATEFISFSTIEKVFNCIISTYPYEFLDIFLGDQLCVSEFNVRQYLKGFSNKSPLDSVSNEELIEWSITNNGFMRVIEFVKPYSFNHDENQYFWSEFGKTVIDLIRESSDIELLKKLINTIYPVSYDSSLPEILSQRRSLIQYLLRSENHSVQSFARRALYDLDCRIEVERDYYSKKSIERLNSFE